MNILYGIQGTGNGHITRARHLAKSLNDDPELEIDYFFSGRKRTRYFDMQPFGDYQTRDGLSFVSRNGKISYSKTVFENKPLQLIKDIKDLDISKYDLVINDFEPLTAWAAKIRGVPSLSVSHQAAFLHKVPRAGESLLDKTIMKYFAPTRYQLGTHWYHFGFDILPPFISKELCANPEKDLPLITSNFILVYLPFESLKHVCEQLTILSEQRFVCFHPGISEERKYKNIQLMPLSTTTFKAHLKASIGVICNSGFELATESLSLGKPMLLKPLHRQYEQQSNAHTLKTLDLCDVIMHIQAEDIDEWIHSKKGVLINYPSDCLPVVNWIKKGRFQDTGKLCQDLWKEVTFPESVTKRLNTFCT